MTRDHRRLLKTLRELQHVTPLQVQMAAIILACNGIEAAMEYANDLSAIVPHEAAEELYHQQLAMSL